MTKKDYELIARNVRGLISIHNDNESYEKVLTHFSNCLADSLELDNDKFNRLRFIEACGVANE